MRRILHEENTKELLGYYLPSFFYIEIDSDNPFDNLNSLTEKDLSTFFHEYTHFLQDITTTFGLTNIINTVNVQKAINKEIIEQKNTSDFIVPVSIAKNKDVDSYANLHDLYCGDYESNFTEESIINHVKLVKNKIIEGHENKKFVEVTFSTFLKKSSFIFGAIQIMENMAFLVERNLFDKVTAPVYPYRIVEKIIDHIYPILLDDDIKIVTICDYALMAPDPGRFLFDFINILKELRVTETEGIYSVLKQYNFSNNNGEKNTVFQLYESRFLIALESIKQYFTVEYFEEINEWFDTLFKELSTFKLENFNFWSDILSLETKVKRRNELAKLTHKFGFPLVSNNNGKVVFNHPKHYPKNLLALRAIKEVSNVLNGSNNSCGMKICCKNNIVDITNEKCDTPWLRGSDDPLCPFGQIIKMWGINNKNPKFVRH